MGGNTVAIWMAAPVEYLLNTLTVGALEKVCFSNTQNPETVCEHIDCRWQAFSA